MQDQEKMEKLSKPVMRLGSTLAVLLLLNNGHYEKQKQSSDLKFELMTHLLTEFRN